MKKRRMSFKWNKAIIMRKTIRSLSQLLKKTLDGRPKNL